MKQLLVCLGLLYVSESTHHFIKRLYTTYWVLKMYLL